MNIAIQGGLDPLQARTITKEKIPDTSFSSNLQCIYKKSDRMMQYLLLHEGQFLVKELK